MELFRSTQLFMPSSSETRVQKCLHKLKGTSCCTYIFGLPTGRPLHSYLSLLTKSKLLSRLERSVPCFYPGCKYGESECLQLLENWPQEAHHDRAVDGSMPQLPRPRRPARRVRGLPCGGCGRRTWSLALETTIMNRLSFLVIP